MLQSYFKKFSKQPVKKSFNTLDLPFMQSSSEDKVGVDIYKTNAIVHRCVSLIACSASHIPWQVHKEKGGKREQIPFHPVARLLKNPAPNISGADFFTSSISSLLLYGNSYILASGRKSSAPGELYNLHASQMEYVTSGNMRSAYKYKNAKNEQYYSIDPITRISRVLHLKNYNPMDDNHGLSSLSAAAKPIHLHAKIMDWNKSLLKNATRPSGALVFQDGNGYLSEEQFERLQQQFYDGFSGASNSGKPLILEGGLKWQETNNAERFEKFIELKDSSARDIAIAFNVPPQLLGISGDNTYSNMQEARLALWEENIIPLLDKYSDALSNWLSHWYEEDLIIDFDRDAISVLTKRRENLWSKISNANFMTTNEKRAFVGLSPIKGGDKVNDLESGE
ncbi:MAG: phage portal protein [Pseudomonadota bacterium]